MFAAVALQARQHVCVYRRGDDVEKEDTEQEGSGTVSGEHFGLGFSPFWYIFTWSVYIGGWSVGRRNCIENRCTGAGRFMQKRGV